MAMVIAAAALIGCSRVDIRELPAYPNATRVPGPERPRLFYDNQVDWQDMPTMVPYAILVVQRGAGVSLDKVTRQVWWKAQELKADAVRIIRHGYSFNDPAVLDYGASLTDHWQKIVAPEYGMLGICLRLSPSKVDLRLDETGALQTISPELKEQGVEKWDRLLGVNGVPVDVANRLHSRHVLELLKAQPGQGLRLTWERPGGGVREVTIMPPPNAGFPPEVPDSLKWIEQPPQGSY